MVIGDLQVIDEVLRLYWCLFEFCERSYWSFMGFMANMKEE